MKYFENDAFIIKFDDSMDAVVTRFKGLADKRSIDPYVAKLSQFVSTHNPKFFISCMCNMPVYNEEEILSLVRVLAEVFKNSEISQLMLIPPVDEEEKAYFEQLHYMHKKNRTLPEFVLCTESILDQDSMDNLFKEEDPEQELAA